MKASELRKLETEELAQKVREARDEFFNARVKHATGQLEVTFEAAAAELSLPNLIDETLFLANRAGVLACIRPKGAPPLNRREQFQRAPARPAVAAQTTSQPVPVVTKLPDPFSAIIRDPFRSRRTAAPLAGSTRTTPMP